MINFSNKITFNNLIWDTDFFGVTSAKAIIHKPLTLEEWKELNKAFKEYQLVTITNENSEPNNAQMIGKDTTAFLADVNIQFEKKLIKQIEKPENVIIKSLQEKDEQILNMADFNFSRFTEDPELLKRGGSKVYKEWILNSFRKKDKFFAISKKNNGDINGFLLYSYSGSRCIIELIAVSKDEVKGGIGSALFKTLEHIAFKNASNSIIVGTQVRNIHAINFYNKVGCKQIGCHEVYHLWNL